MSCKAYGLKNTGFQKYNLQVSLSRCFSHSRNESESNDMFIHFEEFSILYNSDRSSNATPSNVLYKNK